MKNKLFAFLFLCFFSFLIKKDEARSRCCTANKANTQYTPGGDEQPAKQYDGFFIKL